VITDVPVTPEKETPNNNPAIITGLSLYGYLNLFILNKIFKSRTDLYSFYINKVTIILCIQKLLDLRTIVNCSSLSVFRSRSVINSFYTIPDKLTIQKGHCMIIPLYIRENLVSIFQENTINSIPLINRAITNKRI
jgi:hypothetical protein